MTYEWNLGSGVTLNGQFVNFTFPAAGVYSVIVTATNPVSVLTATTSVTIHPVRVFVPLVMRNYVVAPDLVAQRIDATSNNVQVVIKNQGNGPVMNEFWVDVYLNPRVAPTRVNQTWNMLGSHGLVWGVTPSAFSTLVPGGVLTLTLTDGYYQPGYSNASWPLPAGMPVYAQVDSLDSSTTWGAVPENHEMTGGVYNNITGPVMVTSGFANLPAPQSRPSVPSIGYQLPRRP